MRYFVIGEDGQKYGPADVPTLQSWVGEGRLLPIQQVEEEGSGIRMAARAVTGLVFPNQAPPQPTGGVYQQPAGGRFETPPEGSPYSSNYNRPMAGNYGDDGSKDLTTAWVLFAAGLVCCWIICLPLSIVYANKAISKGNQGGNIARIMAIVFIVLIVLGIVAYAVLAAVAVNSGMVPTRQFPLR